MKPCRIALARLLAAVTFPFSGFSHETAPTLDKVVVTPLPWE